MAQNRFIFVIVKKKSKYLYLNEKKNIFLVACDEKYFHIQIIEIILLLFIFEIKKKCKKKTI